MPLYGAPNAARTDEPETPVGTYNASFNVPWYLDFNSVGANQAAACRRYIALHGNADGSGPTPCDGVARDPNFVALALSGGGSRSAALSAAVIEELERIGIMQHVDVISAVSGGAQAAALYAVRSERGHRQLAQIGTSLDGAAPARAQGIADAFTGDLMLDWLASLAMPWNVAATMLTNYDRTDVMAETFAARYYGANQGERDADGYRFRDINPKTPNLLLNAVDMSRQAGAREGADPVAGNCFTLSYETFRDTLASDLHDFPIADAVMATNSVPGMHPYYTLRDYTADDGGRNRRFVHLADGSIRDHLALVPINAMLRSFAEGRPLSDLSLEDLSEACQLSRGATSRHRAEQRTPRSAANRLGDPPLPEKILVIVVDAGIPPRGVEDAQARGGASLFERLFPVSMVIDAIDTTLDDQRALRARELLDLRSYLTGRKRREAELWRCATLAAEHPQESAQCLREARSPQRDTAHGVLGPECCPIIGIGIHNYMKFAEDKFGPINFDALDSDQPWGADLVTLECMADNAYGRGTPHSLYAKLRAIDLRLSLSAAELATIRRAAHALVEDMLVDFCDPKLSRLADIEELECMVPPGNRTVACQA